MGVNPAYPACFFANLYLFIYELAFFRRLLHTDTPANRGALQALRFAGRLIDDVDIISHDSKVYVEQHLYTDQVVDGVTGIYPRPLNLQDSSRPNPCESNFLDLHVHPCNNGRGPLQVDIYDKQQQPAFLCRLQTIRFPAAYYMLSKCCKLNVFDSQFTRYAR